MANFPRGIAGRPLPDHHFATRRESSPPTLSRCYLGADGTTLPGIYPSLPSYVPQDTFY